MAKRDAERELVKQQQAEERAAANAEAQRQAQARIEAAQDANKALLQVGGWVGRWGAVVDVWLIGWMGGSLGQCAWNKPQRWCVFCYCVAREPVPQHRSDCC
jgi:hypothetical protein